MSLDNKTSLSFQTLGRLESLTLSALKVWWETLSNDEQEAFCRIDSEDIMPEFVNVANKAFYLSKMNQAYRKKDLVAKGTAMDENGEARHLMIQFNLAGKEVVKNEWADLLSCLYLIVSQGLKAKEHGLKTETMKEECLKPYISVKRDKLDVILDLLANSVPNFGEGDKSVYDDQTLLKLLPIIFEDSSEIDVSIVDLKPDLKALFENLVAIATLLERQIYLAYFRQVSSKRDKAVVDQFNFLSSQFGLLNEELPTPMMAKTVSQLEKSEKPGQGLFIQPDLDDSPSVLSTRSKFSEDFDQVDPMWQYYEEVAHAYDGFIVEDLVIDFEPSDCLLISDDEGSFSQSYPGCRQHDVPQQYPFPQGPSVNFPMHFPQQHYLPQPLDFGMPMQINQNMTPNFGGYYYPPQGHQNFGFPHSEMYGQQNPAGNYEYHQNFQSYRNENSSHIFMESIPNQQEKPRNYPKPQLPPRLQKKREQLLHLKNSQIVN